MTNDELHALLRAAGTFFNSTARAYQEDLPVDAAAYATLTVAGAAVPEVRVTLMPGDPAVAVGFVYKGEFMPIFSWCPPAPKPEEIN